LYQLIGANWSKLEVRIADWWVIRLKFDIQSVFYLPAVRSSMLGFYVFVLIRQEHDRSLSMVYKLTGCYILFPKKNTSS